MVSHTESQLVKLMPHNFLMSYLITFTLGLLAGFTAGLLVFRKHQAKLTSLEGQVKQTVDNLKK